MYIQKIIVDEELFEHIKDMKTPKEMWDTYEALFSRTNDA